MSLCRLLRRTSITTPLPLLRATTFSYHVYDDWSCWYCCNRLHSTTPIQSLSSTYSMPNNVNARVVSESFKGWFFTGRKQQDPSSEERLLAEIFRILSSHEDERDLSHSLSALGLRVSEPLVLRVLSCAKRHSNHANNEGDNDIIYSCVKFFDWAGRQLGFVHTRITYHAMFKILARAQQMTVLLRYLDNFMYRMYHSHSFYPAVVMGYAIAGKPHFALQLLGRMRFQGIDLDLISYHVLLHSLLENGSFDAVHDLHRQIQSRGFENHFTRFLVVKSLCCQRLMDQAESYLRRILSAADDSRYCQRTYLDALCILIEALCQNGSLKKAEELVEEFSKLGPDQMRHVYGVWLKCLVCAGKIDAATDFLKAKESLEGYVPEVFRYNFLLSRLLKEDRLEDALNLLIDMKENGISPDRVTMSSALCFFCKAGMVAVALDLYNSMSHLGFSPNTMAFNFLINSLCGHGSYEEALLVLRNSASEGCFPGKETFSLLADTLCRESKFDLMMELLAIARERNYSPKISTYNRIISALCSNGRVEEGYLLYGELNSLSLVASRSTYYNLIVALSESRADIAARLLIEMQDRGHAPTGKLFSSVISSLCQMENPKLQFFKLLEMQLSGHEPNSWIYNSFIDGAGRGKKPELAREVYEMMQRNGIRPNLESQIRMLQSYLRSERIADAQNFFHDIRKSGRPHRRLYNIMISRLCKLNKVDLAIEYFWDRRSLGEHPSIECYELLIHLLCAEKRYELTVHLVNEFQNGAYGHRRITSFIGNTLVLHAMKCEEVYEAWARRRVEQNEAASSHLSDISNLIGVFSGRMRISEQVDDLEEAIKQCFLPDIFTYNMLLRRLSMSEIDLACKLFDTVRRKGYKPNQYTYDTLLSGLVKHEKLSAAARLRKEMVRNGFEPTVSVG